MENVDGQTDVGHINLIGGLVTRNPPKNEQMDRKTRQMIYTDLHQFRKVPSYDGDVCPCEV